LESANSSYDAKLFVKVKSRHFRRAKCLNGVALDILSISSDLHRSMKDFAIPREFDVLLSRESHRGVEILSAERSRNALELLLLIANEHWSTGYIETALAFFSCFANRLITLFSALYCDKYCICRNVDRYQNFPAFSDCL